MHLVRKTEHDPMSLALSPHIISIGTGIGIPLDVEHY